MIEALFDAFGSGCLAGFLWGAARVLIQIIRSGSKAAPKLHRIVDSKGREQLFLLIDGPERKVKKKTESGEESWTGTWR